MLPIGLGIGILALREALRNHEKARERCKSNFDFITSFAEIHRIDLDPDINNVSFCPKKFSPVPRDR
jgi:hypothetical protein